MEKNTSDIQPQNEVVAELIDIKDPQSGDTKIYIRFEGSAYQDRVRFVLITQEEFNALVKLFVDKIISTAKTKNDQKNAKPKVKAVADIVEKDEGGVELDSASGVGVANGQ